MQYFTQHRASTLGRFTLQHVALGAGQPNENILQNVRLFTFIETSSKSKLAFTKKEVLDASIVLFHVVVVSLFSILGPFAFFRLFLSILSLLSLPVLPAVTHL